MKLNVDKCHLMICGEKSDKVKIHIGEAAIEESDEETRLGIMLDRKSSFKTNVQSKKQARSCAHYLELRFPWIQKRSN